MTLPKNSEEFAEKLRLFHHRKKYSKPLRAPLNSVLLGLALPCLREHRQYLWGYKFHPEYGTYIMMPIEKDMKALATALAMYDSGEYRTLDIVDWLNKCETESCDIEAATLYHIIRNRRPFKEALMPFEKRMKFLHGLFRFDTPASEEGEGDPTSEGEEAEEEVSEENLPT